MVRIKVKWKGKAYTIVPSHELYMAMDDRVPLGALAGKLDAASASGGRGAPYAHIADICATALRSAGAGDVSPEEVRGEIFSGGFEYGALVGDLIRCYFGVGPQEPPELTGDVEGNVPAG